MQKRATFRGWFFAVEILVLAALIQSFSVAGLQDSGGMMESGRQGIGAIPSPGLQGAEDGV
jgi:hypothetical protein